MNHLIVTLIVGIVALVIWSVIILIVDKRADQRKADRDMDEDERAERYLVPGIQEEGSKDPWAGGPIDVKITGRKDRPVIGIPKEKKVPEWVKVKEEEITEDWLGGAPRTGIKCECGGTIALLRCVMLLKEHDLPICDSCGHMGYPEEVKPREKDNE